MACTCKPCLENKMSDTPDILKKIITRKQVEIAGGLQAISLSKMIERAQAADACRGFVDAIKNKIRVGGARE